MRQKRYDSDVTDSQSKQISRYFTTSRRRQYHLRYHVLDAILYIVKTGTQWALQLLRPVASRLDRVETVFADQAYRGLEEAINGELDWRLQIVESEEDSGFSVETKRWIVERTYGWFGRWRRRVRAAD